MSGQYCCMIMRLNIDCNACCRKLRRIILRMKEIETHLIEKQQRRVCVCGRLVPSDVAIRIRKKMRRRVEILDVQEFGNEHENEQTEGTERGPILGGVYPGQVPSPSHPTMPVLYPGQVPSPSHPTRPVVYPGQFPSPSHPTRPVVYPGQDPSPFHPTRPMVYPGQVPSPFHPTRPVAYCKGGYATMGITEVWGNRKYSAERGEDELPCEERMGIEIASWENDLYQY